MAKGRFTHILAAGLAMTGALQATPVMALDMPSWASGVESNEIIDGKVVTVKVELNKNNTLGMTQVAGVEVEGTDPHRSKWQEVKDVNTNREITRYLQEDGTPFTGLYQIRDAKGVGGRWEVLDKDGCYCRDASKPQYAWDDGKLCADFLYQSGANFNENDYQYYLGNDTAKGDGIITYMVQNDWFSSGPNWYRSHETGVCYRNEWYQDTASGKWYYFGDDCIMVTNKLVNGYWMGADGAWVQ